MQELTPVADTKRKATDEVDLPSANKRIKSSHSEAPDERKKVVKVVPFPEKVGTG